jgi:hypothetical protein
MLAAETEVAVCRTAGSAEAAVRASPTRRR